MAGQRAALGASHVALGLDLRQMSIDPHHEAQQPFAVGDPYNVPARQGLARMSIMQQQVIRHPVRLQMTDNMYLSWRLLAYVTELCIRFKKRIARRQPSM